MNPSQQLFVAIYVGLLLVCAALIVVSDFLSPTVRISLLPIASDGFKTVLGALLGAISVMLGVKK